MALFVRRRLAAAIKEGDLARVKQIVDSGANINTPLNGHETPLHIAANAGKKDIAAFLISRGAKVDALNEYDWAPIHDAAYNGRFDVVVELLKAGADPNLRTSEGKTAYGWAVARKHPEMAELLAPYMKKVVELAVEKNLPPPPVVHHEGWKVLSTQQIARIETHEQLRYRLTDIFNFRDRERVRIVNNLDTKADQVQSQSFDDFADKSAIETARLELQEQGGAVPETVLSDRLHKLPRPSGPGGAP